MYNHDHNFIHFYYARDSFYLVIPLIYVSFYGTFVRYYFAQIHSFICSCHNFAHLIQHVFPLQGIVDFVTDYVKLLVKYVSHLVYYYYYPTVQTNFNRFTYEYTSVRCLFEIIHCFIPSCHHFTYCTEHFFPL